VPWYGTYPVTDGVKFAGIAILLSVFLWPVMAIARRVYGSDGSGAGNTGAFEQMEAEKDERAARWPSYARMVAGAAALLFLAFVLYLLPAAAGDAALIASYRYDRAAPLALAAVLAVPAVAGLLSVVSAAFLIPVWGRSWWTLRHRVHYTLVVAGLFLMMWWANYWNLFFFRL
jgi:hypothetical protein